jgi:hypothetical protein
MIEHHDASEIEQTPPLRPPPTPMRADERASRYTFAALPIGCGWNGVLSALLRQPGQIVYQLHESAGGLKVVAVLAGIALLCLLSYGVVVGLFSGGTQLWAAPLKITSGALLAAAICLPSLYVLACLGGAHDKLKLGPLAGLLLAAVALNAILLVSFAPIAWVFSQSTDSIAFISCLHLVLWGIGFYFGLRLVLIGARFLGVVDRGYLLLWIMLVTLVSLQMMTTLRPIVGRSERLLPAEKKFFLNHLLELFGERRVESASWQNISPSLAATIVKGASDA